MAADVKRTPVRGSFDVRAWPDVDRGRVFAPDLGDVGGPRLGGVLPGAGVGLVQSEDFRTECKYVFLTANPPGDALHGILDQLVTVWVLEFRDDEERWRQYRWAVGDSEHTLTKR